MIPQNERQEAQILQFSPPELRAKLSAQRQANWKLKSADLQIVPAIFGGGWYHEAAIIETGCSQKP